MGLAALDVTWWYYISKFPDFFDSFFFVLRKKFSHLSSLHVIHHGGLPIAVWFGPKVRRLDFALHLWTIRITRIQNTILTPQLRNDKQSCCRNIQPGLAGQ